MIREVVEQQYPQVIEFLQQDCARNYFILLGVLGKKPVYSKIIGEWDGEGSLKAALFQRKSGNLQFYSQGDFDREGFAKYIADLDFNSLIGPSSYCDKLYSVGLFSHYTDGAIIAKLPRDKEFIVEQPSSNVVKLKLEDLDRVVQLYSKVFTGFSPKAVMEEKIKSKRGRGVCIWSGNQIIAVAQSELEMEGCAIIVGVATHPDYQGRGLASQCLYALFSELREEGKDLYLQYDNMDAGRIYERLGFAPIDRVKHYIR